jgi:hypothetical protein
LPEASHDCTMFSPMHCESATGVGTQEHPLLGTLVQ